MLSNHGQVEVGLLRVDEVATLLVEVVHHFEGILLAAFAHDTLPGVAKVHGAETYGADMDGSGGSEDTVTA